MGERWIIKSRLCARGFLDKQKQDIMRHSSTASRLSHKMACSLAVTYHLEIQAWDISTAFLQGLQFNELRQKAQELGHEINVPREVFFF